MTYHATLLSSIAVYRLSPFHPLAKYPGPITLKLSRMWVYRMAKSGKRHEYIRTLHEIYHSDIVRIGPNEVSISDASAIGPVLGQSGLVKGPGWDGRVRYMADRPLISWRDPVMHAKRRHNWNRGLSGPAIKVYEPVVGDRVVQMVDLALKQPGEVVDMVKLIKYFAFDIMGDMGFGGGSELMRDGDTHGFLQAVIDGIDDSILSETFPWLAYYARNRLFDVIESAANRAKERVLRSKGTQDLFYYLSNEDGNGKDTPPLEVVIPEGVVVSIAGSDTTSFSLNATIHLLISHSSAYKRLQEEVDRFYPPGENAVDTRYHSEMPYLDAVINEALRLYPVLASGSHRATQKEAVLINAWCIPPNTSVRVHTWSVHRDPRNFSPSSDSFWPERWLLANNQPCPDPKPSDFVHNTNAFHTFSFGPANCTGKALALREMKMLLCHMFQQMDMKFAEGYDPKDWDKDLKDAGVSMEVGMLPVICTPRHRT
ncbi:cytochrome P450 [Cristinia sonorae]|uniref:Cytochrome P450 n=1 Tax=Cristinia sonorae TaxID=1940300 RepID=A0A8K0USB8_9AGAR|nr:cytochrome P450 [Cristinia sonorae]